jgi:hypothetical protein
MHDKQLTPAGHSSALIRLVIFNCEWTHRPARCDVAYNSRRHAHWCKTLRDQLVSELNHTHCRVKPRGVPHNPSKAKFKPKCIFIEVLPCSKQTVLVTKTNQLMLYSEIIAACSQIHTKHINTLCGQNVPRSKHTLSRL